VDDDVSRVDRFLAKLKTRHFWIEFVRRAFWTVLIIVVVVSTIFAAVGTQVYGGTCESLNLQALYSGSDFFYILDWQTEVVQLRMLTGIVDKSQAQNGTEDTSTAVVVTVQQDVYGNGTWITIDGLVWNVALSEEEQLEHSTSFPVYSSVKDNDFFAWNEGERRLLFQSTETFPIAISLTVDQLGFVGRIRVAIAAVILVVVYVLIVFELVHRVLASMVGAFMSFAAVSLLYGRPSLEILASWIDFQTLGLLLGMMIMVGILSETGLFEWLAVRTYVFSRGVIWRLAATLCLITAFLSSCLDNVTTMLLISPVCVRLAEVMDWNPVPLLLVTTIFSNIGGTATLIGDPPNVIVAEAYNLTFLDFLFNLGPLVLLCLLPVMLLLRLLYLKELQGTRKVDVQPLLQRYVIHRPSLLIVCICIFGTVVLLLLLQPLVHLEEGIVAMLGATLMMLFATPMRLEKVVESVEWATLFFFASLFIMLSGLGQLGLFEYIGQKTAAFVILFPPSWQLFVAVMLLLWVSALVSAFIDNIPYTATMVNVIVTLSQETGLPLKPLAWALCAGACLGGNGTQVGASANLVTVGVAEQAGYPVSFIKFFRVGFPVMLVTIVIASFYMVFVYVILGFETLNFFDF
jgi:Na+/H+ antiporter NhaD/arsenite permease-like protein